jgi:serine/threonine-protein kinase RsbW
MVNAEMVGPDSHGDEQRTLMDEPISVQNMAHMRTEVLQLATRAGLSTDRAEAFVIAVNEAVANAIEHAGGSGDLTVVQDDERQLIAEVRDAGPGMPCSVTLTLPPSDAPGGRGMWLAAKLTDNIKVHAGRCGTTVRLEMDLRTP